MAVLPEDAERGIDCAVKFAAALLVGSGEVVGNGGCRELRGDFDAEAEFGVRGGEAEKGEGERSD